MGYVRCLLLGAAAGSLLPQQELTVAALLLALALALVELVVWVRAWTDPKGKIDPPGPLV